MLTRNLQGAANAAPQGWDLANAVGNFSPSGYFSLVAQGTVGTGISVKSDGTKMYVIGASATVYEYTLSSPWDVSTASYVQNFSVAAEETSPTGLFFKPDGTKMYIAGPGGREVNEYDLSSAWDISTASYLQNFSFGQIDPEMRSVFFSPDGTNMYVVGPLADSVRQLSLSTAWDISTATLTRSLNVRAKAESPNNVVFSLDGTKMYITDTYYDYVAEYTLSSAWDISTATFSQSFSVAAQTGDPAGIFFRSDGAKMYIVGSGSVFLYDLGIAWNVSTAAWLAPPNYFSVAAQEGWPKSPSFKPDGTKMYVLGAIGVDVNEYTLSSPWNISTASYVQNFSVAAQEASPNGLFFKSDGTKMYVVGSSGDDINEYNLSSAWDVSTASYAQNFSVAAQETSPQGLFFKSDGTKMYVVGSSGDDINEYNLSSAWDISTSAYLQRFSVAAQETSPTGIFFKSDGTKMYIVGQSGDDINEYTLSSAWDVSTASYVQNFSVAAQETAPTGLFFKPDGTKMYITGLNFDAVWAYDL